jgi:hypothetical protein
MYRMELALIMFLCENSFHARFIRLFYYFIFLFQCIGGLSLFSNRLSPIPIIVKGHL